MLIFAKNAGYEGWKTIIIVSLSYVFPRKMRNDENVRKKGNEIIGSVIGFWSDILGLNYK